MAVERREEEGKVLWLGRDKVISEGGFGRSKVLVKV